MPTHQVTYTDPQITRSLTEAVIEFDIITDTHRAWESIRIERSDDGIRIDGRGEGALDIPTVILPIVLAELDRLAAADEPTPFEPVAAIRHVAVRHVPGITEGGAA